MNLFEQYHFMAETHSHLQFSDEIDFGKPVEIAHLDVPMTNVLNPFQSKMMQYRVVEMNGIYYTILLNEMFPPLTLINSSSTPLLYSVDSVKNVCCFILHFFLGDY